MNDSSNSVLNFSLLFNLKQTEKNTSWLLSFVMFWIFAVKDFLEDQGN